MKHIVKRRGHKEKFDERKLYASCYAACLSSHIEHEKAEKICSKVAKSIRAWIKGRKEVTSEQIFNQAAKEIKKYDRNASFMYETHRDLS